MFEVCLASPPSISEFSDLTGIWDEQRRRVPLGSLVLAAALEQDGRRPQVLDLDELYAAWVQGGGERTRFVDHAAGELAARDAGVYGLGSICSSYPVTLRIATALKTLRPASRIVLGGPQATATDLETLAAFPAVDLVVRGEADATLPELVRALEAGADPSMVAGVTHRVAGRPVRAPDAPLVDDLDAAPRAAYHLCAGVPRARALPVEVGRGCPFACTFCSTSSFFGRRFRLRSPDRVVEDMRFLQRTYGTRRFELVHDNFTVDRRRVLEFCRVVEAAGLRAQWTCSSRADSVDDELLRAMRRAGCDGIFFGIESGSHAVQQAIGKRIDLGHARRRVRGAARRRIRAAVAFIVGFPGERREDLASTVDLFVDSLRSLLLEPQISLLSPLPGTALHRAHRQELVLDDIPSDMVFQGQEQDPADRRLIARHPGVFSSFYGLPLPWLERRELYELRSFLNASTFDLRWLVVAAARLAGGALELFRSFQEWRAIDPARWSFTAAGAYYRDGAFREELIRFVREHLAPRAGAAGPALRALADFTSRLPRSADARVRPRPEDLVDRRRSGPKLAPGLVVSRIDHDGAALIRCVRRGGDLSKVARRETVLVARRRGGRIEVRHLGGIAGDLLELCDGTRDTRQLARAFGRRHARVGGVPAAQAVAVGLAALTRSGLLVA